MTRKDDCLDPKHGHVERCPNCGFIPGGGRDSGASEARREPDTGTPTAAANPAVESLADFILPKAAVNLAARTLYRKGSSKPFVCQECMMEEPGGPAGHHCYEVCQRNKRIRALQKALHARDEPSLSAQRE